MSAHTPEVHPRKRTRKLPVEGLRLAAADPNLLPRKPSVASGVVRLGIAAEIAAVLRRLDVDPDDNIQLACLVSPPHGDRVGPMPVADLGRLVALCVARTNCPAAARTKKLPKTDCTMSSGSTTLARSAEHCALARSRSRWA